MGKDIFTFVMNATTCMQMKHIIVRPVDLTVFGLSQNRNYKEKKWSGKKKENDYY